MNVLSNIRVVLARPTIAGNIGGSARALATMGLSKLQLIAPRYDRPDDALARARGAEQILADARIHPTLATAVADTVYVVGLSGRRRDEGPPMVELAEAAEALVANARRGPVAVVFGTERMGLANEELGFCHLQALIPTGASLASLNLTSAVQVTCYAIRQAWLRSRQGAAETPEAGPAFQELPDAPLASQASITALLSRLEATIATTTGLDRARPRDAKLLDRVRRLLMRAQPREDEIRAAHAVLKGLEGIG